MPPLHWHWWWLRQLAWCLSHSQAAKGKGRLYRNTGACAGSQTHFVLSPYATDCCRLPWAHSHALLRVSVFLSTHYLHQAFDFSFFFPFFFFFHLKVIAIPGAFIFDDVVVVRWSTCSSQSVVDLNAGESQQWAERRASDINLVFKQPGCIPDFRDTSLCGRLGVYLCLPFLVLGPGRG